MRKPRVMIVVLLLCAAGALWAADQKPMSVTVKVAQVRATPGYLGAVVGKLNYGDLVTVLDQPPGRPRTGCNPGSGQEAQGVGEYPSLKRRGGRAEVQLGPGVAGGVQRRRGPCRQGIQRGRRNPIQGEPAAGLHLGGHDGVTSRSPRSRCPSS